MLILLSAAKTLNFDFQLPTQAQHIQPSAPFFLNEAAELIAQLKTLSVEEIAQLMHLSPKLAQLNHARFCSWQPQHAHARAAIFAFQGDAYTAMDAFSLQQFDFLNQHLLILSGLYGALNPFDSILPYRLEMGCAFPNTRGKHLYDFWGTQIAKYVEAQAKAIQARFILNLASDEYFKVLGKHLRYPVLKCVFEDEKNQQFKVISFYAKRARGMMARFIIENQITHPEDLKAFHAQGYQFSAAQSDATRFVFRRHEHSRT